MNAKDEGSISLWATRSGDDAALAPAPLERDLRVDVAVVGAGIAGLSTAYELARLGLKVAVLDRGTFGGGMTGRTTAHLASALDDLYSAYADLRGETAARMLYEGQAAAIERIDSIARTESVDCDFARVDGFLFGPDPEARGVLERERDMCRRIGFEGVEFVEAPPQGANGGGGCLRFPRQARFDPLAYCRGLVAALSRMGAALHSGTAVTDVKDGKGEVELATEAGSKITAEHVVLATNSPIVDRLVIHGEQAPYRTYAVAFDAPKGTVPDALIWDTLDPYHYVRIQPEADRDVVIVGGEDHRTGTADDMEDRFSRLESWSRERWPALGAVRTRWSGQVQEPFDGAPFIGRSPGRDRVFIATGDSGQGMTNGVMAALILTRLVTGRTSPFTQVSDPSRLPLRGATEFLRENLPTAANLMERLTGGERREPESLGRGEAAVLIVEGRNVAAYRDEEDRLHLRSAVCSHAGCVVHWNSYEKCWECPCHGSHFAPDGEVLNAPAMSPLEDAEAERNDAEGGTFGGMTVRRPSTMLTLLTLSAALTVAGIYWAMSGRLPMRRAVMPRARRAHRGGGPMRPAAMRRRNERR